MSDDQTFLDLIDACLCTNTRITSRIITRVYNEALTDTGININQLALMLAIHGLYQVKSGNNDTKLLKNYPIINEVSDFLKMDQSTVSRNLRTMEGKSLIEYIIDEKDRKIRRIKLTKEGIDTVLMAYPLWLDIQSKIKKIFSEDKFLEILELIKELGNILNDF